MKLETIHQEFVGELETAFDDILARHQADVMAASPSLPEGSEAGLGAINPALLIKYLPVVLDTLSALIKRLQSA